MLLYAGLTLNPLNRRFLCGTQKRSRAIIRVKAVTPACGETDWATLRECTHRHTLHTDKEEEKKGLWWHFITEEVHVSRTSAHGSVPPLSISLSVSPPELLNPFQATHLASDWTNLQHPDGPQVWLCTSFREAFSPSLKHFSRSAVYLSQDTSRQ